MSPTNNPFNDTIECAVPRGTPPNAGHYLRVVRGAIGRLVPLSEEPLVLGRDPSRAFHLADDGVSRSHCEVFLVGRVVLVRDLGSTNGTFVDGVAATETRPLPPSSLLEVGRHALRHELLTPEEVARHAQLERELERARRYVEGLIPPPLVEGPLRAEWCFVPSLGLGGDALGYTALDDDRLAFYVADVCGHGVDSAMHVAAVINALRGRTLTDTDFHEPAQVLARLNEAFGMDDHSGMFFSIWYGVLERSRRRLRFSSAGHPPAILRAEDGRLRARLGRKNPPVGTLPGRVFGQDELSFEHGERLYVFSDGVFEIQDREGRERGYDDLEHWLAASSDRSYGEPARIYDAACRAAGTELLEDDFTMLVLSYAPSTCPSPS